MEGQIVIDVASDTGGAEQHKSDLDAPRRKDGPALPTGGGACEATWQRRLNDGDGRVHQLPAMRLRQFTVRGVHKVGNRPESSGEGSIMDHRWLAAPRLSAHELHPALYSKSCTPFQEVL